MIQKNKWDKEASKNAKKAWKQRQKTEHQFIFDDPPQPQRLEIKISPTPVEMILTGIVDGERILEDDYPVYPSYTYVIDDNGGQVIICQIQGTIKDLKESIRQYSDLLANNIYNCNRKNRHII